MVAFVGRNHGAGAAKLYAESGDIHPFSADTHAAIAEDAARAIKKDDRRPLLFILVQLAFHIARLGCAVLEGHVLQFALAAGVADGAVERVVAEQEFDHRLARLADLVSVSGYDHAIGDRDGAGGLQLGHFFNAHQAHAARRLEREARVIAERGYFNAHGLAGFNKKSARGRGDFFAVDGDGYVLYFFYFGHVCLNSMLSRGPQEFGNWVNW